MATEQGSINNPEEQPSRPNSIARYLHELRGLPDFMRLRQQYAVGNPALEEMPDVLDHYESGVENGVYYATDGRYILPYEPDFFLDHGLEIAQICDFPKEDDKIGQKRKSQLLALVVFYHMDKCIVDEERQEKQKKLHWGYRDQIIEDIRRDKEQESIDATARRLLNF